jgi:hypothetical protein
MIKLILCGIWACVVTLLSCYAAVSWNGRAPEPETQKVLGGVETVRTRMISVPVVADGAIQGYVMAQFVFTVDAKTMKHLAVKPDLFLLDEAFKTIYSGDSVDFRQFKKQDLPALSKRIGESVNKRLGANLINDVLIQELNYIAKDHVRGGTKK